MAANPFLKWSDWHTWKAVESAGGAPEQPGVYEVRATTTPGVALPIHRALAVDPGGVVYIGSGTLRERIGRLLPSDSGKHHHSLGATYDNCNFDRLCPYAQLEVRWATVTAEKDAVLNEQLLGDEYVGQFLSLPPANMRQPGR